MLKEMVRRHAVQVSVPVIGALLLAYFGYHAVEGGRGLLAYLKLAQAIKRAEITRDLVEAERAVLEKRVALLRPTALDPDMLEERARLMVNLGKPGEVAILLQRSNPGGTTQAGR